MIKGTLKSHGDLCTMNLPDGVGIAPLEIMGNRFYSQHESKEEFKYYKWYIKCNITARKRSQWSHETLSTNRVLVLSDRQFVEFKKALTESDGIVIWEAETFVPNHSRSAMSDEYSVTDNTPVKQSWIKRLFNFPSELSDILMELRLIVSEANTHKNNVVVMFDREESELRQSRMRKLENDYRSLMSDYTDVLAKNEHLKTRIASNRAQYDEWSDSDAKLIRELQLKISTQEEDVLREAELIKSRIAAEQAKEVNGNNNQH